MLLPFARTIPEADAALTPKLTPEVLRRIVDLVPDEWLEGEPSFADAAEVRSAYAEFLTVSLEEPRRWAEALEEARGQAI